MIVPFSNLIETTVNSLPSPPDFYRFTDAEANKMMSSIKVNSNGVAIMLEDDTPTLDDDHWQYPLRLFFGYLQNSNDDTQVQRDQVIDLAENHAYTFMGKLKKSNDGLIYTDQPIGEADTEKLESVNRYDSFLTGIELTVTIPLVPQSPKC